MPFFVLNMINTYIHYSWLFLNLGQTQSNLYPPSGFLIQKKTFKYHALNLTFLWILGFKLERPVVAFFPLRSWPLSWFESIQLFSLVVAVKLLPDDEDEDDCAIVEDDEDDFASDDYEIDEDDYAINEDDD